MSQFCTNCGREVEESWNVCPDCGKVFKETAIPQTHPRTEAQSQLTTQATSQPHRVQPYQYKYTKAVGETKYGTGALVCAILGLIFGFLYGTFLIGFPLLRIVAVILGGIGISRDDNKSMAIAGLVLGVIGLVIFLFSGLLRLLAWGFW